MHVAFEGIDGSGKMTLSNRVAKALRAEGLTVEHVREGGAFTSRVTQALRELGRDARNLALSPIAELLVYLAREAQLLAELTHAASSRSAAGSRRTARPSSASGSRRGWSDVQANGKSRSFPSEVSAHTACSPWGDTTLTDSPKRGWTARVTRASRDPLRVRRPAVCFDVRPRPPPRPLPPVADLLPPPHRKRPVDPTYRIDLDAGSVVGGGEADDEREQRDRPGGRLDTAAGSTTVASR